MVYIWVTTKHKVMKTEEELKQIAVAYIKPFRHTLHLGEDESLVNDLVSFAEHIQKVDKIERELLQECLDTFTCQDEMDRDLKQRIEIILNKYEL